MYDNYYDFEAYQIHAKKFAVPLEYFNAEVHGICGLVGEAGEIAEKFKKSVRDDVPMDREDIGKELGDVLWYVAYLASHYDLSLSDIAVENLRKLQSRFDRNQIQGSGDNR